MTPTQVGEPVAVRQTSRIDSWVVTTGLATTRTGIAAASSSARAMRRAWSSTTRSTSAPYRCWLPVTNQTSRSASAFIESPRRQGHRPVPASPRYPRSTECCTRVYALECSHVKAWRDISDAASLVRKPGTSGRTTSRVVVDAVDEPRGHPDLLEDPGRDGRDCEEGEGQAHAQRDGRMPEAEEQEDDDKAVQAAQDHRQRDQPRHQLPHHAVAPGGTQAHARQDGPAARLVNRRTSGAAQVSP